MDTLNQIFEEFKVRGKDLAEKIRELIHEGNVRRIIVKDERGHTFMEIPLTVATIGIVAAPILAAVGAIAGMAANFRVTVERNAAAGASARGSAGAPATDPSVGATEDQVDMKDTDPKGAGKDSLGG